LRREGELAAGATPILAGDGTYSFEIIGEGRRQAELEAIAGGEGEFVEQECLALLLIEASHPHAPIDVRVEINGRHVGNLSRSDAATYQQTFGRKGRIPNILACRALISGGDVEASGRGYSVELDLVWPPRLEAAGRRARSFWRGDASRRGRLRGTLVTALLMSIALVAGIWYLPPPAERAGNNLPAAASLDANAGARATDAAPQPVEEEEEAASADTAPPPPAETQAAPGVAARQPACPDPSTAARAWSIVSGSGVVTSMSPSGDMAVNDRLWDALPQDDRIRFALAGFCRVERPGGAGAMLVVGTADKRIRGSVVDGLWLNPAR
jgi:hypothetical protein